MKPQTFFTLTDKDTRFTNSRSERFTDFFSAKRAAEARVQLFGDQHPSGRHPGVYILHAVALVEPTAPVPVPTQLTLLS